MDPVHLENSTDPRKTVDFIHTFLTVPMVHRFKCFGVQSLRDLDLPDLTHSLVKGRFQTKSRK